MRKSTLLTAAFAILLGFASCNEPEGKDPGTGTEQDPLTAPVNLSHSDVTHSSATLGWDAVESADSYNVRINDEDAVPVTSTSYDAENLAAERNYVWSVQAVRGDEVGPWSDNAMFTTEVAPLEIPSNLAAGDITYTSATLSWDAVRGATGYEVRLGEGDPVAVTETTYSLTLLDISAEHTWSVRTIKDDRQSEWAEDATFSTTEIEPIAFAAIKRTGYYGAQFGEGTSNFRFYLENVNFDGTNGYMLSVDLITDAIDDSGEFVEIPEGRYPFVLGGDVNAVRYAASSGLTYLLPFTNNMPGTMPYWLSGGVAYISGDSSDYHMEFLVENATIGAVYLTWDGPFQFNK